jgi:hypothetical protein
MMTEGPRPVRKLAEHAVIIAITTHAGLATTLCDFFELLSWASWPPLLVESGDMEEKPNNPLNEHTPSKPRQPESILDTYRLRPAGKQLSDEEIEAQIYRRSAIAAMISLPYMAGLAWMSIGMRLSDRGQWPHWPKGDWGHTPHHTWWGSLLMISLIFCSPVLPGIILAIAVYSIVQALRVVAHRPLSLCWVSLLILSISIIVGHMALNSSGAR